LPIHNKLLSRKYSVWQWVLLNSVPIGTIHYEVRTDSLYGKYSVLLSTTHITPA
jgi:hypothetical protein